MSNTGQKRYCAGCGKWLLIFPDQEEFFAGLKPEDRLHEACKIDRDEVLPATWHCSRCDRPLIVFAESIPMREQSMYTPDILWSARVECEDCGEITLGCGKNGTHAAKMLAHELRMASLRRPKIGG